MLAKLEEKKGLSEQSLERYRRRREYENCAY
jgi:hypothetical protein